MTSKVGNLTKWPIAVAPLNQLTKNTAIPNGSQVAQIPTLVGPNNEAKIQATGLQRHDAEGFAMLVTEGAQAGCTTGAATRGHPRRSPGWRTRE